MTRVDSAFAGRAYAAYGGIYIATSLVWLWVIEVKRQRARTSSALFSLLRERW